MNVGKFIAKIRRDHGQDVLDEHNRSNSMAKLQHQWHQICTISQLQDQGWHLRSHQVNMPQLDMDAGKHKHMKLIELYQSRKKYCDNYLLIVFWKHIDQEERHHKFLAYHAAKNKHT